MTDPEFSLKVSLVMRPCDGTSGLVRGNRRKAVFAFKGLFTEGICPYPLLGSGLLSRISEVRGKSKLAAHTPIFANKIAGRKSPNPGPSRQVPFFLPHFRVHLSIMCGGLWNLRKRRPFSIKRIVPRGASGARLFWLNYSILNAHRAQFSMTIRTIFKWASTG